MSNDQFEDDGPLEQKSLTTSNGLAGSTGEDPSDVANHFAIDELDRAIVAVEQIRAFLGCAGGSPCDYLSGLHQLRVLVEERQKDPNERLTLHLFRLTEILHAKTTALLGTMETISSGITRLHFALPESFSSTECDDDYGLDAEGNSASSRLSQFTRGDFSGADHDDARRKNSEPESDT